MEVEKIAFFDGHEEAAEIYDALESWILSEFAEVRVKVQKTQISFGGKYIFAMASLPRKKKERGLLLSFGTFRRIQAPRIYQAVEPYPGRWTHHVLVEDLTQLDGQLKEWLREAWWFSREKGR